MRVETRMKTIEKPTTVYIACDGTEFEHLYECVNYEDEIRWDKLNKVKQIKDAEGFANTTGDYINDENNFYWFVPQNEDDIKTINENFVLGRDELSNSDIGEVICIEESQDCSDGWVTYMKSGMDYVKQLFDKLGYDVEFIKREEV